MGRQGRTKGRQPGKGMNDGSLLEAVCCLICLASVNVELSVWLSEDESNPSRAEKTSVELK